MGAMRITRGFAFRELGRCALTTVLATTPEFGFEEFVGGMVYIPVGSPITLLTFYASPYQKSSASMANTVADTPTPVDYAIYTSGGVAVTLTVAAGQCYNLPADIFGAGRIKMIPNAAGSVEVSLKG